MCTLFNSIYTEEKVSIRPLRCSRPHSPHILCNEENQPLDENVLIRLCRSPRMPFSTKLNAAIIAAPIPQVFHLPVEHPQYGKPIHTVESERHTPGESICLHCSNADTCKEVLITEIPHMFETPCKTVPSSPDTYPFPHTLCAVGSRILPDVSTEKSCGRHITS